MALKMNISTAERSNPATQTSSGVRVSRLDWVFIGLIAAGIIVSGYLTWTHLTDSPIICTADQSCDTVNRSAYAYFPPNWGIPVAYLGLLGYVGMLGLAIARWRQLGRSTDESLLVVGRLDMTLFVATLIGVLFSAYLTAMEIWVIHAICWWCVSSALIVTGLFAIAARRVWNAD